MKYARIEINAETKISIVVETFIPLTGHTIDESFTQEVVKMFEQCPDDVMAGWIKNLDGSFSEPPKVEQPIEQKPIV